MMFEGVIFAHDTLTPLAQRPMDFWLFVLQCNVFLSLARSPLCGPWIQELVLNLCFPLSLSLSSNVVADTALVLLCHSSGFACAHRHLQAIIVIKSGIVTQGCAALLRHRLLC